MLHVLKVWMCVGPRTTNCFEYSLPLSLSPSLCVCVCEHNEPCNVRFIDVEMNESLQ